MAIQSILSNTAKIIGLTLLLPLHTALQASSEGMFIETPCEIEWRNTEFVRPMEARQITSQKGWAERGDADAQYFMALASPDKDERAMWLNKAIANGSKGAAAYFAYVLDERWKTELIDPANPDGPRKAPSPELVKELMQPVIEAAEAGEAQAATWLMNMGRDRWHNKAWGPHPFLKLSDRPKWAEIAARGGNPAAAEFLCQAHDRGLRVFEGVEKDDAKGFYWCSIAAVRTCSISAKTGLSEYYLLGRGVMQSKDLAAYWKRRSQMSSRRVQVELLDRSKRLAKTKIH